MVDNIFQITDAVSLTCPNGLLDRVEHQRGRHCRCHPPAQDPAGIGIGDKRDVGEPLQLSQVACIDECTAQEPR